MASHLTITSGGTAARAFGGQLPAQQDTGPDPRGLKGLFAALLDGKTGSAGETTAGNANGPASDVNALFQLGLEAGLDDGESADAEALAAMDGQVQQAASVEPKPMVDFIEALSALRAGLERGEPLDPELIAQAETALTGLAEALGLDLGAIKAPDDFAALLTGGAAQKGGLEGALAQLLAPLAQPLAEAHQADDAATEASTSKQLKALGDKLGALLAALEDGAVSPEKLAALGMAPGKAAAAEIETALARFAALAPAADATQDEPVLASPALKLTEPALVGKGGDGTDAPASAEKSVATAEAATNRQDNARQNDDRPARDRTSIAAPAARDASGQPAPSTEAGAQAINNTARIDAAANPRIIQAGYQTSQQQLNLPQIAFELARQVQDGNTRFQIRLDPPELGRIDVRLDIDQSGKISARLMVEKSETLDLMQRDQRGLERALQQAGLDAGKTNLEFSLKQNPFAGQQGQAERGHGDGSDKTDSIASNGSAEPIEETAPTVNLYRGALQASGINIIA